MRALILLILGCSALLATGCDGDDISDKTPSSSHGRWDAAPMTSDASPFDAMPDNPIDAGPSAEAQTFCARFDELCGYGVRNNYYVSEEECLASYDGYDSERQICVEGELDAVEDGGSFRNCVSASGSRGCS